MQLDEKFLTLTNTKYGLLGPLYATPIASHIRNKPEMTSFFS
jgi:hypothetical protein